MGGRELRRIPYRLRWVPVIAYAGFIYYLSDQPQLPMPPGGDKTAHVGAYTILGFLLAHALAPGRPAAYRTVAAAVGASLYGISDEWHQSFVPGRDASLADILADMVGAILGAVGYSLWCRIAIRLYEGPSGVSNSGKAASQPSKEAS